MSTTLSKPALALLAAMPVFMASAASVGAERVEDEKAENPEKKKTEEKAGETRPRQEPQGSATVVVTAKHEPLELVHTQVAAESMEARNAADVSEALAMLPGVTFTMNSRGEKIIYVRGLDPRQVPVYLDGIPSYVPYDGQMDFAHFSTSDIEEIEVAKGFSSVILGPNTLGGAINLVTKRPTKIFEGNAMVGATDGDGKRAAANIGSAHDRYFVQAGWNIRDQGDFRMSSGFVPTPREDGGKRDNSYLKDSKFSAKFGFTPTERGEYIIGYMRQSGEKGTPVATYGSSERYWRWPTWDKENIYFLSHIAIGQKSYLKLRAFHDSYKNTLLTYTDNTYTALVASRGTSTYDDFTGGGAVEFGTTMLEGHNIRAVVQMKTDAHRSIDDPENPASTWGHLKDSLSSVAVEDSVTLNDRFNLTLGLGLDRQKALDTAEHDKLGAQTFLQGQAGLFWNVTEKTMAYLTVARKGKFPTLRDRYSLRFGTYIPNPDLKSEESINYDLGIKSSLLPWLSVEGTVFHSDIKNLIERVRNVEPGLDQMRNVGKVRHQGLELSVALSPARWFEAALYYTYIDRENLSDPDIRLRSVPHNRLTGYAKAEPSKYFYAMASVECQSTMWDSDTDLMAGYTVAGLSVGSRPFEGVSIEAGFTNVLDRDYQQSAGHPLPGRTWFVNCKYKF